MRSHPTKALILCASLIQLVSAPLSTLAQLPQGKTVVYLFIGHSNMAGRAEVKDTEIHPRCFNYAIDRDNHAWEPAQDIIHEESYGANMACSATRGCLAMRFSKRMAQEYPDYNFGILQNAHTQATLSSPWAGDYCVPTGGNKMYKKGGTLYNELLAAAREIKDDVAIGGLLCLLGQMESSFSSSGPADRFGDDIVQMVKDFRQDLGIPDLPFLIGMFNESAPNRGAHWQAVSEGTNAVPSKLSNAAVVRSEGPYVDGHHYNDLGYKIWSDSAAATIKRNGWLEGNGAVANAGAALGKTDPQKLTVIRLSDALRVSSPGIVRAQLVRPGGTRVLTARAATAGSVVIPTRGVTAGVYVVRTQTAHGKSSSRIAVLR